MHVEKKVYPKNKTKKIVPCIILNDIVIHNSTRAVNILDFRINSYSSIYLGRQSFCTYLLSTWTVHQKIKSSAGEVLHSCTQFMRGFGGVIVRGGVGVRESGYRIWV